MKHKFNEDVELVITHLIEDFDPHPSYYNGNGHSQPPAQREGKVFHVRKALENDYEIVYNVEVPQAMGLTGYVNKVTISKEGGPPMDGGKNEVMDRLYVLVKTRDFPPGSVFVTPWGKFYIG